MRMALRLELNCGCGAETMGSGAEIIGWLADTDALKTAVRWARATPGTIPSANPTTTAQLLR
jgi:hypothetical protein